MAKIGMAKKICYENKEEEVKYKMIAVRAWNTLNRVRKLDDNKFVKDYKDAYSKAGTTTGGQFLERTAKLLEEFSEEYNNLDEDDKKIIALLAANQVGKHIGAGTELTCMIVKS